MSAVLAVVLAVVLAAGNLYAVVTTRYTWYRVGGESAYEVRIAKTAVAWASGTTMTYSSALGAYYVDLDVSSFTAYDMTSRYHIMENGSDVLANVAIFATAVGDTLRAHRLTGQNVHNLAGGANVVGDITADTLTNKTIDGDDNTLKDIAGSSIKTDAVLPQHSIKPSSKDTYLFFTATDSAITMQGSDAAKVDDDSLIVIVQKIYVQNDAGSAIKISHLAAGTVNGDAVRYDELAALTTRVDNLERNDVFSANPGVIVALNTHGTNITATWRMSPAADEDSARRYDVYYSWDAIDVDAGATDAADLAYLRSHASLISVDAGDFESRTFIAMSRIWVVVVAVDWAGTMENSDEVTAAPEIPPVRDNMGSITLSMSVPLFGALDVAYPDSDSASAVYELECQGTTAKDAMTFTYVHGSENQTLRVYCHARAEAGTNNSGYVQVALARPDSADAASVTYFVTRQSATYSATADVISVDLSGLTSGVVYHGEVRIWATGTGYSCFVRGNVAGEVVKEVAIQ